MKNYIKMNTEKRMCSTCKFEKCFYKLILNSLYGKSIENVRKRVNFKSVNNDKKAINLYSKSNYKRYIELDKENHVIELSKLSIVYDKPIYLGMCILDLSKLHMYGFHYNIIKPNFECNLLYTDTDSLMYKIYSKDIYSDLKNKKIINKENNKKESIAKYIDHNNTMQLGLFKDECEGKIINSFVGLKSKLYSILFEDNTTVTKCKGVNKNVIKKEIPYNDYINTLFNTSKKFVEFSKFKSSFHNIQTIQMKKLCLDNTDDKRICYDGINTFAIGHYKTK